MQDDPDPARPERFEPRLLLHVRGAAAADRRRGAEAALAVLIAADVHPADASYCYAIVTGQGDGAVCAEDYEDRAADGETITQEDYRWARAWREAEAAAIAACRGPGAPRPAEAFLEWRDRPMSEVFPESERQDLRARGLGDQLWWLED
jgi:hypothetical protein